MAAYFIAQSAASGQQLYKLEFDESVTQWTDIGNGLNPQPVSAPAEDPDSTPLSTFNNALWFQANNPTAAPSCTSWVPMAASPFGKTSTRGQAARFRMTGRS